MDGIKVKATVARTGIDDIQKFVGLPFLTPKKKRLGEIIAVDVKSGPYCELTIMIDPDKVTHPYVKKIFFPHNY